MGYGWTQNVMPDGGMTKSVSVSTGTLKATPGVLFTIIPTTSGDVNIKDGGTENARLALVAGTPVNFTWGFPFTTSITISASAAVATYIYR